MIEIEEGALFVADAHYPTHGDDLLDLLHRIEAKELTPPQLFFMGDIFDLLVGGLEKSYAPNSEAIRLIESLSRNIDIFYFEGNHDFQLDKIFKNIKIFPIGEQPQYMEYKGFIIGLSHGDRFAAGWKHALLGKLLRKPFILKMIKLLRPRIIEQKRAHLATKEICHPLPDFEGRAKKIFDSYRGAYRVIEGHYHQAQKHYGYISLPSLACQKQIGIMKEGDILFVTPETLAD